MGKQRICELCSNNEAVACCLADSAFLCMSCDAKVHSANFLVARHVRYVVCSHCQEFTGEIISGLGLQARSSICPLCSPEQLGSGELDSLSSSSSSACFSSAQSSLSSFSGGSRKKRGGGMKCRKIAGAVNGGERVKRGIDSKMVGVLVHWCRRLGLNDEVGANIIRLACNGMAICASELTILPFHVCLAASLRLGLRFSGIGSFSSSQGLIRLEQITGVPAKLISLTESKIERLHRSTKRYQNKLSSQNHNQDDHVLKEGWDESS